MYNIRNIRGAYNILFYRILAHTIHGRVSVPSYKLLGQVGYEIGTKWFRKIAAVSGSVVGHRLEANRCNARSVSIMKYKTTRGWNSLFSKRSPSGIIFLKRTPHACYTLSPSYQRGPNCVVSFNITVNWSVIKLEEKNIICAIILWLC